ncbi:MAG: FAD-binding oxidoreductase [Amaricoccus sp.]
MLDDDLASSLAAALRGDVLTAGDPRFEAARALHNGMIDLRPRLIARCANVADVIAAVNFGRGSGLPVAIRGGGHNGAGLGSVDDGLVIDLTALRGVRVDPAARTVRVEAGCTTGDVDQATHAFGLAVPSGIVSTTGIAGLTLGGGHGYLSGRHGLTVDSLLEADVVLADGSFVTASAESHPDLFWALRGGGGNFGVVTSFVFRAHPITSVFAGPVAYPVAEAGRIMRRYRDWLPGAPEELCVFLGLKTVVSADPFPREHWGERMCLLMTCHDGDEEAGRGALAPLLEGLPEPFFDWRGTMPYPAVQSMFDGLLPSGLQWYWRGDLVRDLPDAAIDAHLAWNAEAPSELSVMHLYPIDGAVRRKAGDAVAWARRDATWSMVIAGIDPDPAKAPALRDWARSYWEAVHPYSAGGVYPNFLGPEEPDGRLQSSFGANWARLVAAKRRYDPRNLFRRNNNIPPE